MSKEKVIKTIVLVVIMVLVAVGIYLRLGRNAERGLADLPEGIIAQGKGLQITESDLDTHLANLPEKQREIGSKDREGVLKELIEKRLLLAEAKSLPEEALPDTTGKSPAGAERMLLDALREHVTKDAEVPEEAVKMYYEEHRSEYEGQPGGSYEEMRESIAGYLRYDMLDKAFEKYRESLIARAGVRRDRDWVGKVRAELKDPLTEARASAKVVIADFGRGI